MPTVTVIELEPLALSPAAAARYLSISKRSLSRLITDGKIVARKAGPRTLVDVASLKAYYESRPKKDRPSAEYSAAAHAVLRPRSQVRH